MIEANEYGLRVTRAMLNTEAAALLESGRGLLRRHGGSKALLVDLEAVSESDSSALAVLFAWMRSAQAAGVDLRITRIPDSMVSQAKLYGVYDSLPLAAERAA